MKKTITVFNRRIPNPVPLFVSAALLISLFALSHFNQSTAWYMQNKDASAYGMQVTVADPTTAEAGLIPYAVSSIEGGVYKLSEEQSYTLPSHDPNGIIYNANEKALVILVDLSVTTASNISVKIQTSNTNVSYAHDNVISNCMKITQATYDATNRTASPSAGTTQSFVTVSGTSVSKTSSLNLSSLSLDAGGKTTLCYIIEYYQEFFNHVRNDTNVSVDEMNFINDIEFVIEFVEQ